MLIPNSVRARLSVVVPLLGMMALLSCQNDSTGPKSDTSTVSATLPVDAIRLPDSVSWAALGTSGAFKLTITSDTTFHVQATLPQPLGSDTLTLSAWTLTLRTTVALFQADAEGTLHLLSSTRDSLSIRLLQAFDSLRTKSPTTWGSSSDPKATQIASLEKAYATLLLARDSAVSGFPAVHPVGIDSLAMVDQLLLLSAQDGLTYHTLDSLVPLDSTRLRTEVRVLAVAGKLDSNAIFPPPPFVPNHAPSFAGALSISRTFDTTSQTIPNWITAISPGPSNESSQKVHFEVVTDSGANFFSVPPSVDSTGTLRFQAKSVGRGVFRVRAHDNGDSTGTNVNVSGWTSFTIQLFSRPVLTITGIPDTIRLVEDSATTLNLVAQNILGSTLSATFTPADTTLISAHAFALTTDATGKASFALQAKTDVFGGPLLGVLKVSDSLDGISQGVYVVIAERNHPPTFGGAPSLLVTASTATIMKKGWIDSISPGPPSESSQKVSFQAQILSGASLFATAPTVDSTGTLSFPGNANASGVAQIQVRALDNDSVDPGNRYSAWKTTSITFNQPPTLTLPAHTASTWENQPVAVGAATVLDLETSVNNLVLTWTVSDSTILPSDSILVPSSGGSRNIQMRPILHRWGQVLVTFTLADSDGGATSDTLLLTVNPINHAPVLTVKSPTLLATTWKGAQTFVLASAVWDEATPSQSGHYDLQLANATDSVYLSTLSVDSAGTLHVAARLDTAASIGFRIRAHDNGGTANGGIDTSAWSNVQTLQLVDTVLDLDGNSYRARRMPDGNVWMRSNLYTKPRNGDTAFSCAGALYDGGSTLAANCPERGALYNWNESLNQSDTCDTSGTCITSVPHPAQGLCPTGWHVAESSEWSALFQATMVPGSSDSSYNLRGSDSAWGAFLYAPFSYLLGSGKFGNFLVATDYAQDGSRAATGVNYWLPHLDPSFDATWAGKLVIGVSAETFRLDVGPAAPSIPGSVRCVVNPP